MALTADFLLLMWASGCERHPIDRALLLYAVAAPDSSTDELADRPLGERNSALLRLRQRLFGEELAGYCDCPHCGERLEFTLRCGDLLAPAASARPMSEVAGLSCRPPTSRDLAEIARLDDPEQAMWQLLKRCCGEQAEADLLPAFEAALEQADPCADCSLELGCEACGQSAVVPFDIAHFLWEELAAQARRLLDEVHLLARAYGWSEAEILALPAVRRQAYLKRVLA